MPRALLFFALSCLCAGCVAIFIADDAGIGNNFIAPLDGGNTGADCATGETRTCAGGCRNIQTCTQGSWGPCLEACGAGLTCLNDTCVCTPTSCSGCCTGNTCLPGNDAGACGTGGGTCDACPASSACVNGVCDSCNANTCDGGCCSGATCKALGAASCALSGAACTTCNPLQTDSCSSTGACRCGNQGPCAQGQRCLNGVCACDATSCAKGCCTANGCQDSSVSSCGMNGNACVACDAARADRCELGECRCGAGAACDKTKSCSLGGGSLATSGVGFNDSQDRLVIPASAYPTSTSSWTFASWVRLAVDRNQYSAFFTIEQPAGHSVQFNELVTLNNGTTLVLWDHAKGTAVTLGELTVGTWYFAAVSVGPSGATTAYFAPAGGSLTKRTGTVAVISHIEMSYLGSSNFAFTEFLNGSMAMARLWNGVLTEAEIAAEFTAATPVRRTGLIGDWRLSSATTAGTDSSGLGHSLKLDFGATHTTVTGPSIGNTTGRSCK